MAADFGVEFFFTLLAPELVEPVEFHAARSCFVNINNSFFLNSADFGAAPAEGQRKSFLFSTDLSKSTIFVLLLNNGLLIVQTLQQRFHEEKALV